MLTALAWCQGKRSTNQDALALEQIAFPVRRCGADGRFRHGIAPCRKGFPLISPAYLAQARTARSSRFYCRFKHAARSG